MEQQDENRMMEVIDANGNKTTMLILFTTRIEDNGKDYVFYYNPEATDGQVYVSTFTEDGHLDPVEDDAEWEKLEDAFNQFQEEANKQRVKNSKKENCHCHNQEKKEKCLEDGEHECDCSHNEEECSGCNGGCCCSSNGEEKNN